MCDSALSTCNSHLTPRPLCDAFMNIMPEKHVSRPWNEEEDHLLKEGVALHGDQDKWKTIALSIPGRSNKACRKRWLHSLSPTVKKTAWSLAEDARLVELYNELGPKWSIIAREIQGRTDDACSKRYREALDPSLKKEGWTPEEDEKLMEAISRLGGKWGQVGAELQRSGLGCRNRWRLIERKQAKEKHRRSPEHIVGQRELQDVETPEFQTVSLDVSKVWVPCYPPEAYPTFPEDDFSPRFHTFREPTPETHLPFSPYIAPFHFSSSSLSAALSDPPRLPRPLPPITTVYEELPLTTIATPDGSPSKDAMTLDDPRFNSDTLANPPTPELCSTYDEGWNTPNTANYSPVSLPPDTSLIMAPSEPATPDYPWRYLTDRTSQTSCDASPFTLNSSSLSDFSREDLSSSASTPFTPSASLSPVSSPNPVSSVELPYNDRPPSGSLLFSSQPPSSAPSKLLVQSAPRTDGQARLSSLLPLSSDFSVRPYACGSESCWPSSSLTGLISFTTAKALHDHIKRNHPEQLDCDMKPFRCSLTGCGKSWKSLNGLQYHLQVSTSHFKTALSTTFTAQAAQVPEERPEDDEEDQDKRTYACPREGCYKAYRQPSGLRYHHLHGHPQIMPVQLDIVPPALAKQLSTKIKKMRPKPYSDTNT